MNKQVGGTDFRNLVGTAYMSGLGGSFETEAVPGALPVGQSSPQRTPFGLYAEKFSATAFTAPRAENRRSWLYRLRPTASHSKFEPHPQGRLRSGPFDEAVTPANRLRWDPLPIPAEPTDFVDGLITIAGNGDPATTMGSASHVYVANRSMDDRVFFNADGEMLLVPQTGSLLIRTEFGRLDLTPGEIAVIPRGVRFAVELTDGEARGYVCENYGPLLRLPELGPIGSDCLANTRDFLFPTAWYEDVQRPIEVVQKFMGRLWSALHDVSPFDVVAWHGNLAPYKYDLARFNTINTVSYDHPDPSIFTVLTSPSEIAGTANVDFVIFPPRWMVAEHTFRPPWLHRNVMSEFMGLIHGAYDAKEGGFLPGGASLHNCMSGHGPDAASYTQAIAGDLKPHKIENTMAFMFESRWVYRPTAYALASPACQTDYDDCWQDFPRPTLP